MDVFQGRIPDELAGLDIGAQTYQPANERLDVLGRHQPSASKAVHMGDRAGNVVSGEGMVEIDRARELGHALVRYTFESTAPHPHGISSAATAAAAMVPARG